MGTMNGAEVIGQLMASRMKLRVCWLVAFCALSMAGSGCSSDSGKGTVSGTVTLDGQPLQSGLIRFVPVDGRTPTAEATITDGDLCVVPVGEKQVSISCAKVVGNVPRTKRPTHR